jgi:hypothetical protein
MPSDDSPVIPLRPGTSRDVLDVLASGIAKLAASDGTPKRKRRKVEVDANPPRDLLNEKMLAERWACSVSRLQRWRSVGEGPPYLKIVGKVLYRIKDIEAYEEASLIKTFL